jgi:hypothetical protein
MASGCSQNDSTEYSHTLVHRQHDVSLKTCLWPPCQLHQHHADEITDKNPFVCNSAAEYIGTTTTQDAFGNST